MRNPSIYPLMVTPTSGIARVCNSD